MKRLTTDNPKNNTEVMLNYAYAEDRWVKIRGLEKPFMQYIREKCKCQGCNLSELDDMETSESVTECAFSNNECPIFMLFIAATQAAELRERLKEYENTGYIPKHIKRIESDFNALSVSNCALKDRISELEEMFDRVEKVKEVYPHETGFVVVPKTIYDSEIVKLKAEAAGYKKKLTPTEPNCVYEDEAICPCCGDVIDESDSYISCVHCGQVIDWRNW